MKRCPACSSQYSDPTLSFCLQDGTPLVEVKQSTVDTVSFSNPVTAEKIFPTQNFVDVPQQRPVTEVRYQAYPQPMTIKPRGSRKGLIAGLSVLSGIVVLGLGIVGWMYLASRNPALAKMNGDQSQPMANVSANPADRPADVVTPISTKSTTSSNTAPAGKIDPDSVRKQITGSVDSWKSAAETCNVSDYANKYGEKVEYHDRHGVTAAEIKGDLQKICDGHNTITINVDNMVVAVDAEGDAATAIFDKEWRYEASPKLAQGKAHVKIHFRKVGDDWKIVSETNLKTYYAKS